MAKVIDVENLTITKPSLYEVTIKGLDGILFNRMVDLSLSKAEKKNQEKRDPIELERENWREKTYFNDDGTIYIPGENIHQSMQDGAKYWGQKIPGEGNKTYTNVVASAIVCENLEFGIKKDSEDLTPFGKMVNGNPSKGKKSGAKVYKIRPLLRPWGGAFRMHVFDARLTPSVLEVILNYAGMFCGLCDWRPTFGRFEIVEIKKV